jgi:hypothetical protein
MGTKTIKFSGHSDDIVYMISDEGEDESYEREFIVATNTHRMRVKASYDGVWAFSYGLVDEGEDIPDWTVLTGLEHSYSMNMELTVPTDATVSEWGGDEKVFDL